MRSYDRVNDPIMLEHSLRRDIYIIHVNIVPYREMS